MTRPPGPRALPVVTGVAPAAGCNCPVCPWFRDNPHVIAPLCSGSNTDCSYCGCARAEQSAPITDASPCGQCSVRCGSRTDIGAWMADVGNTLTFDELELPGLEIPQLPSFVPQVDQKDLTSLESGLRWPAYAMGLRRVFSPSRFDILPGWAHGTAREVLGLGADQRAVLVGYGKDPLVEALWTRRHQIIPKLAEQRWDLVLAPNYSMYGNYPRAEQLLNFRRNLQIAHEMCAAGIPAVPNLYWFRLEDLQRYADWAATVDPPAVAVNVQTFRTDSDWTRRALPGLTWLAQQLRTHVIVTGASRADRIAELVELFGGRMTLVAQNALAYARHGAVMTAEGRRDVKAHVADAFAANVTYYQQLVERR